jgi:hypothetical protein
LPGNYQRTTWGQPPPAVPSSKARLALPCSVSNVMCWLVTDSPIPALSLRGSQREHAAALTCVIRSRTIHSRTIQVIRLAATKIAAIIGICVGTATARLKRARHKIRRTGNSVASSVSHDRSGEFASASLVREEPEPPSNRAGAVRFGQGGCPQEVAK